MHILIKTITGKSCALDIAQSSSTDSLYSKVEELTGIPADEQKLISSQGKRLESGKCLIDYELSEESTLYLVIALDGGAKGKKKKKDVKKGKKKHKKKKVKLAILKYFKVEGSKVVLLRQPCKVCPAGTFVADHKDRLYCGRCHSAYMKVADTGKKGGAPADKGGKGQPAAKGKGK
jgi:small subunit ribosomal protein S27Ae